MSDAPDEMEGQTGTGQQDTEVALAEDRPSTGGGLADNFLWAFATPILVYQWHDSEALNTALKDLILSLERDTPGVQYSNVGGWHSTPDFLSHDAEAVKLLTRRIETLSLEMTKAANEIADDSLTADVTSLGWATVLRQGGYHVLHNHPNFMWSGTYYVAIGTPEKQRQLSGLLEFVDPRRAAGMITVPGGPFSRRHRVHPRPGLMVVFPSWLDHFVHPYFGGGERITVSFNVNVLRLNLPEQEGAEASG